MSGFYQDIITQKSWQTLIKLKKETDFILIGGWAVYLYTSALKSKDIDIIVDYTQLSNLKKKYEIFKNERLKKYEAKQTGVDIDIYLPHYSNLGLSVEEIVRHQTKIETFKVPKSEILLITKQKAYFERKASIKGQKDKIDIVSLILFEGFDFGFYKKMLKKYRLDSFKEDLVILLRETKEAEELGLNRHTFSKRKKEVLKLL